MQLKCMHVHYWWGPTIGSNHAGPYCLKDSGGNGAYSLRPIPCACICTILWTSLPIETSTCLPMHLVVLHRVNSIPLYWNPKSTWICSDHLPILLEVRWIVSTVALLNWSKWSWGEWTRYEYAKEWHRRVWASRECQVAKFVPPSPHPVQQTFPRWSCTHYPGV